MVKPGASPDGPNEDDFRRDFTDEDNLMYDAYLRNKQKTSGTLADVRLAQKKAAQKAAQRQGRNQ